MGETVEAKEHWKGRLKIYWVKAHADNLKRKSTEDEKGNQTVDALADQAYEKLMNKEIGQRGVIDTKYLHHGRS